MCDRSYSLPLRLVLAVIVSIFIIIIDSQLETFVKIRTYMDTAINPIYFFANITYQVLDNLSQILSKSTKLVLENHILRKELLLKNSAELLLEQYKQENSRLRRLLGSPLCNYEHKIITQVISTSPDPYSDQIVIDKGLNHGVYIGQPVISDQGVVGQVIATNKLTSRVLLICDTSHALPIQVLRNNTRMIVTGHGCTKDLQLDHLPGNIDIHIGDILVTSGLDGRFPTGYPVAMVSSVKIDNQHAGTVIHARPTAVLQNLCYLLLIWNTDTHYKVPMTPDTVNHLANERLTKIRP